MTSQKAGLLEVTPEFANLTRMQQEDRASLLLDGCCKAE